MRISDFMELMESGELSGERIALTIGVFDGVHRGHQKIFSMLKAKGDEYGCRTMAISFSVNPKPSSAGNLDTLRLRAEHIGSFGIDFLTVIDFSDEFSKTTAWGFAHLLTKICVPCIAVVGADFRFGNPSESASAADLSRLLAENGVSCDTYIADSVLDEYGIKVSSTHLRQLIEKGDLRCFLKLSGQFYRVDLVPLPYRSCSDGLIISRGPIHQLLPPQGAYDAQILFSDGRRSACIAMIDEEFLHLSVPSDFSVFGSEEGKGNGMLQLDSLFLEKKR